MPISFPYSECGASLKVPDNLVGKKCKCSKCATVNVVPAYEGAVNEVADTVPRKAKSSAATVSRAPVKTNAVPVSDDETEKEAPEVSSAGLPKKRKNANRAVRKGSNMLLIVGRRLCCARHRRRGGGCGGWQGPWWYLSSRKTVSETAGGSPTSSWFADRFQGSADRPQDATWPTDPDGEAKGDLYYFPAGTHTVLAMRVADIQNSPFYRTAGPDGTQQAVMAPGGRVQTRKSTAFPWQTSNVF